MTTTNDNVRKAIFSACRKAALEMGDDLRGLSWFYRNSKHATEQSEKKVA